MEEPSSPEQRSWGQQIVYASMGENERERTRERERERERESERERERGRNGGGGAEHSRAEEKVSPTAAPRPGLER